MSNIPSGLYVQIIPGQGSGLGRHDVHYYYTVSASGTIGESLPSVELDVILSGQLSMPLGFTGTGVTTAGTLPSGIYRYAIVSWDGYSMGTSFPNLTTEVHLDPSGTVIQSTLPLTNPGYSGVNVMPFSRSAHDPVFSLQSGIMHLMPYQGTAYVSNAPTQLLYHLSEGTGSGLTDSSSFARNTTISGFRNAKWISTNLITPSSSAFFSSGVSGTYIPTVVSAGQQGTVEMWFTPSGLLDFTGQINTSGNILEYGNVLKEDQVLFGDGSGVNVYLNGRDDTYKNRLTFRYVYPSSSGYQTEYLYSAKEVWSPDEWYHVGISWGPISGIKMYVNNRVHDQKDVLVAPISGLPFTLLANPSGAQNFAGAVKEFRYLGRESGLFQVSAVTSGRIETSNILLSNLDKFRDFDPNYQVAWPGRPQTSGTVNLYYSVTNRAAGFIESTGDWIPLTSGQGYRQITGAPAASGQIKFRADLLKQNTNFDDPLIENLQYKYVNNTTHLNSIQLSWNAVSHDRAHYSGILMSGYRIYRASGVATESGFPPSSLIATIASGETSWTDTGASGLVAGAPNMGFNNTWNNNAHLIRWSAGDGNQSYYLYRTLYSGNYPTKSLIASGITGTSYLDNIIVSGTPAQGVPTIYRHLTDVNKFATRYRDVGVIGGQYYSYKISAVNEFGVEGPLSQEITIRAGDTNAPSAPMNLLLVNSSDTFFLNWTNGSEVDLDGSEVSSSADSLSWTVLGTTRANQYNDPVGQNTRRFYRVRNFDLNQNYSDYSAIVSGVTTDGSLTQFALSNPWEVAHNNSKKPIVQILNSNFSELIPSGIRHLSDNVLTVTFATPQQGYVIIEGTIPESSRYEQNFTSATTWTATHNLSMQPLVAVIDSNMNVMIPSGINYLSQNSVSVNFNSAQAGTLIAVQPTISSGTKRYQQTFGAATTWEVSHNIGFTPVVQVLDTNWNVIIPSGVRHLSTNAFSVTFTSNQAGTVICEA